MSRDEIIQDNSVNAEIVVLTTQAEVEQCAPSNQVSTKLINADCGLALKNLAPDSIDLIMTSPPYANQRHHTYGGICADQYVDWFMPIADELFRVLKPTGSFILNLKEHAINGERHTYVMNLIIELRKRGWLWTEEYIWHKRNACPGKWPNRFRDAWERCEHFTKNRNFCMYQDAVMVPMGEWRNTRLQYLKQRDHIYRTSKTNSGFGKKVSNWIGRKMAYPDNVLYLATETRNKGHSAVFPESLPEWFIKLFTKEGDTVLDPFMGSGTTLAVSQRLRRHSIGIDIREEYCALAAKRLGISGYQMSLSRKGMTTKQREDLNSCVPHSCVPQNANRLPHPSKGNRKKRKNP